MDVVFFETPDDLRQWFEQNHDQAKELWVGYYRKDSGKTGITWAESVDQALCFGWIDGIRKSVDSTSYANRFTPRRKGSTWSAVNIKRVGELTELGLMKPAGLKAFEARKEDKSSVYSYEQEQQEFSAEQEAQLKATPAAWEFFQAQAASYRKAVIWWVISAKKEETKVSRLAQLIEESAQGKTMAQFTRRTKAK